MKRIGVITSGGDCGGLNAVVKGTALMAMSKGVEVYVIPNGYAGLYNLINMKELTQLNMKRLNQFQANLAGSEAGHSRVKIRNIENPDKYDRIKKGMKKFGIEGLVISGGDDTGSVMVDLHNNDIKCAHAPKTMDLDLQPYSVGGDSTINRIANIIQDLKTTGRTHNRVIITEVFGRYAGHTAFRGGVAADADCILIPEIPIDWAVVYKHLVSVYTQRVEHSDVKAGTYTMVVAEGLKNADGTDIVDESVGLDSFGHKKLAGAGKYARRQIEKRFREDSSIKAFMKESGMYVEGLYEIPEVRMVVPGHIVRSGNSSAYDVNFGWEAGGAAVLLLLSGKYGMTVNKVNGSKIEYMPAEQAIKQRYVDLNQVAFYEASGICFGRKPVPYKPEYTKITGIPDRIY